MSADKNVLRVQIGPGSKHHAPLGFGGSFYGPNQYTGQEDANLLGAMETAFDQGITHFDTASGYGDGYSERLIGRFLAAVPNRREKIFLASKVNLNDLTKQSMLDAVDASLKRLQTEYIDLYYIHWPRTGQDLRPLMEGLEIARHQGKIHAAGVSNFSIEQMQQVSEVGQIDAHQLGYNLLWRFPERDIIPYCAEHNIAVVAYSAIAHGILTGRYEHQLSFPEGDQRNTILLFREDVWSRIYPIVESFKRVADRAEIPLLHLAIRWLLYQTGVTSVLVSAKNVQQAKSNGEALNRIIPESIFDELTAASDLAIEYIPDLGNPFGYYP